MWVNVCGLVGEEALAEHVPQGSAHPHQWGERFNVSVSGPYLMMQKTLLESNAIFQHRCREWSEFIVCNLEIYHMSSSKFGLESV